MILESISVSSIPCGETSCHNSLYFILRGNNGNERSSIARGASVCSTGSKIILRDNDCDENDDANVYCGTIALYLIPILWSNNCNENEASSNVCTGVGPCNPVVFFGGITVIWKFIFRLEHENTLWYGSVNNFHIMHTMHTFCTITYLQMWEMK